MPGIPSFIPSFIPLCIPFVILLLVPLFIPSVALLLGCPIPHPAYLDVLSK